MPKLPDHIREIASKTSLKRDDFWDCQGTWVVLHRALERIAAEQGVQWDPPEVISTDAANDVAIIAFGWIGERMEWSVGEASDDNYPKRGKAKRYPWAMAEKRAKDRVILKLVGLSGYMYSESESDDFRRPEGYSHSDKASDQPKPMSAHAARKTGVWENLKREAEQCSTVDELRQWWDATKQDDRYKTMPISWRDSLKDEVITPHLENLKMRETV